MNLPSFGTSKRHTVRVHRLLGGVNYRDTADSLRDDQLSDCCDLQEANGVLRCRAGFVTDRQHAEVTPWNSTTRRFADREGYQLILTSQIPSGRVSVTVFDPKGVRTGITWSRRGTSNLRGFAVEASGKQAARFTTLLFFSDGTIVGAYPSLNVFEDITDEIYQPLLMVGATPVETTAETRPNGTWYEETNRLTDAFRCQFSSDGVGLYYFLPYRSLQGELSVSISRSGGTVTLTVPYGTNKSENSTADGYAVLVNRHSGYFYFVKEGTVVPFPDNGLRGNILVTARRTVTETDGPVIADMQFGCWFGGDRDGVAGGTRLFLGGCLSAPHLIAWSGTDNPLYFPQSSFAAVGNPQTALTAFGRQSDALILLKESEVYAAEYQKGKTVTAEQLQNGETVSVSTTTAQFPITPLHAEIGCDLPETVALFGNRLVWACQSGHVYTLSGIATVSRRQVLCLSQCIEPRLQQQVPEIACGAAVDEAYYLLWDDTLWKLTEADDQPVWMRFSWHDSQTTPVAVCRCHGGLRILGLHPIGNETPLLFWYREEGTGDTLIQHTGNDPYTAGITVTAQPVCGYLRSKQYDGGEPDRYKSVQALFAEVTASSTVHTAYLTERGVSLELAAPAADGLCLTPHISRCRRFGVALRGEGLTVGSLTIRMKGGMR